MDYSWIGYVVGIIGAILGIVGWRRTVKKDDNADGENRAAILTQLTYIQRQADATLFEIRDIKNNVEDTKKCMYGLTERIAKCEEAAKSAHHRIDEILKNYEGRLN